MNDLTAKVAVVTGASMGIGAAVAACHAVAPGMIVRRECQIVNLTSPASYLSLSLLKVLGLFRPTRTP